MDVLSLLSISFIQTGQVVHSLYVIIPLEQGMNCTRITMSANQEICIMIRRFLKILKPKYIDESTKKVGRVVFDKCI